MLSDCTINEFISNIITRRGPLPLCAAVELTSECNNRCIHCYVVQASDYISVRLPTPLVMDLLAAAQAEGTLILSLTGGEPLMHPDFEIIYRTARISGFVVTIVTNGTLIDELTADLFAELPPWRLAITVYGATEETYTAVTRNPCGYQALVRGLAMLAEREVPFELRFIALRETYQEVGEFIRLADRYGAPYQIDGAITPAKDGCKTPLAHRLLPAELACCELSIPQVREELSEVALGDFLAEGDQVFQCNAGLNRFFVDALGRMSVCIEEAESWPLDPADVQGSLRRIFYEQFPAFLNQRGLAAECQECALWSLCQRCPAWRLKEAGHRGRPVDFFCELARHRTELLGAGQDAVIEPAVPFGPAGGSESPRD